MNRCLISSRATWLGRIGLAFAWVALAFGQAPLACAQTTGAFVRNFPASAQQASMVITQAPVLLLNGLPERLSPGARVRDTGNLIVQPSTIAGNLYLVNYVREFTGLIRDVWILTPDEAAVPLPTQPFSAIGAPPASTSY
jgi:hypothetical protein